MSVVQTAEPAILSFTDSAADKVRSLISEEANDNLKLRVFVTGGGCSGFQYGFSFDEDYKNYPCRCKSKNCCGYIVREGSRWRIKKKKKKSNK